ncbi:BREX system P-loop protein BrxC [Parathalassolituus penaei]|uniref:BREX system P-loop protein BrxC n=1 Tax=Parathalassolituus penaei TaxID=2997323 RepID=A0A9X3IUA1_9GAMM|nr:BREX system P-loop protein BrxC [Parathalassolituus penaei]MCY0967160.1 BREX system P-loop protein BrxC [Parathalassolituus penaei]
MSLKSLFLKEVDRPIEGVIKADDNASLRLELEEYVLTNEIEKRMEEFLEAYTGYAGANGVWVSGFFGSGKSHLLKMLALLLENHEVGGTTALQEFLPKCKDNPILKGLIEKATAIPAKSILFNIDQKADIISKDQIDALVAVFVKVFDEMCGYYGKHGHIAQFERDLDSRDLLQPFRDAYQQISGKPWEKGREQALLENRNIAKAYAAVSGGDEADAKDIIKGYKEHYKLSIDDFGQQVADYIERQPKGFRLNFFVDEVGQYIADNTKLMTNLQTVAETLATKCNGQAWVLVTAQEEMKSVIGEMNKQQSHDFSKIQARFKTKMKLTSADVAEVIQRRLLTKTDSAASQLNVLYDAEHNNFKTLFDFGDNSVSYRNFRDCDHFVQTYPFIPYQFALFQSAINNLSLHNAFEGRHSSVGERSMLGVFQQVAVQISDHKLGDLASFDLMFEGIRTSLKSQIQRAIIQAEQHLQDPFAVKVLKALFLVKYVREFKATVRNLCVLMLGSFQQPLSELREQIEHALNLLEQQTYIQRNGDLYEFLTDDEKDVEEEIKSTEVESTEVAALLHDLVFNRVIKQRKIRVSGGTGAGVDYNYSQKLDDKLFGREQELAINIISPFHEHSDNQQMLITSSTYNIDQLFVCLPSDDRLIRDLTTYKQTEKYVKLNFSSTQQESIKRILQDKGHQNQERYKTLEESLNKLIGKAKILVAGCELEISSTDAQSRIVQGFQELVTRAYPNLKMLRGVVFAEDMIKDILSNQGGTLLGGDATQMAESETEVLSFISSNSRTGIRTSLKSLVERFERKPYGWNYPAILCVLANLLVRNKVEAKVNSNTVEDHDLERVLRNTQSHGNTLLEPQQEFTPAQVRGLKDFYSDYFNQPAASSEPKALGTEIAQRFIDQVNDQLKPLVALANQYPFLQALNPVIDLLGNISKKPYSWFLIDLKREEDKLLDLKEDLIDPILQFMNGAQRGIYDDARKLLSTHKENFSYVDEAAEDIRQIRHALDDAKCFKGNRIQQIKQRIDQVHVLVDAQISAARASACQTLDTMQSRLETMESFLSLPDVRQQELLEPFGKLKNDIQQQQLIAVINDRLRRFEDDGYERLLSRINQMAEALNQQKKAATSQTAALSVTTEKAGISENFTGSVTPDKEDEVTPQPTVSFVAIRTLEHGYAKALIENEQDVESYLETLREALNSTLKSGKKVRV